MALSKPLRVIDARLPEITQLCLGGRGIQRLEGLAPLTGLQVLWVHDNQLTSLDGLDANTRLRQLYVHVRAWASRGCSMRRTCGLAMAFSQHANSHARAPPRTHAEQRARQLGGQPGPPQMPHAP